MAVVGAGAFVNWSHLHRGRAEQEPRVSIPVPAVPVSELLAGKKTENF